MYYDRVFDLLADNDVVPIQHYLRDLNDAQRFSALTALAGKNEENRFGKFKSKFNSTDFIPLKSVPRFLLFFV